MDKYQKLKCEKAKFKRDLLNIPASKKFSTEIPVVCIDLTDADHSVWSEQKELVAGVSHMKCIAVVVTDEPSTIPKAENIHVVSTAKKEMARKAADVIVLVKGDVKSLWKTGTVPVAPMNGSGTLDFNPLKEQGNGFYFKNPTKWEIFAAVVRAIETYQFSYDWENLVRGILKTK